MDDLREVYRVIRELADAAAKSNAYKEPVRSHCSLISGADLFQAGLDLVLFLRSRCLNLMKAAQLPIF